MKSWPCYIIFFLLASLLPGCGSLRNEVDPGQLGIESAKLVVSGFLSPQDTILAVKVTRSATVVGDSIGQLMTGNAVTDATVTLSEGGRSIVLPYNNMPASDSTQPYYSASARLLPILVGHTYTLSVVTTNGQRVTSTCTIPQPVKPVAITFDSLTQTQNKRYFVRVRWQDPAGQENYYQVAGLFRYIVTCPTCVSNSSYTEREAVSNLSFDDDNRGLFSDAGIDGNAMISGRAFLSGSTSSGKQTSFSSQYKTATATVNLLSVDQPYYQYWSAVLRQRRVRNNPFAEPVLIPSNIVGGLGCFMGYSNSTLTLRLK